MSSHSDVARPYFCHVCNRTVTLPPPPSPFADVSCPVCQSGFIEELDISSNPNPTPNPNPNSNNPFVSFDLRQPSDVSLLLGPTASSPFSPAGAPHVYDPFAFIHSRLNTVLSGGTSIQIVVDNNVGSSVIGSDRMGDYFFGPGLEQLIQQLAENDPNRYGTPPASKSAVASLPDIKISSEHLISDSGSLAQCSVCMDSFEVGSTAKQLPCKHLFHKDCILPWLELHSSCPVCRFVLPTDDGDNDNSESRVSGESGVSGASRVSGERRFRVSLPWWLFRGSDESGGSSGGGTRQEDLD